MSELIINVKGPNRLELRLTMSASQTVLQLKQAIAEECDVEADRQRIFYSGRVLKDGDKLGVYKIRPTHTLNMMPIKVATLAVPAQNSTSKNSESRVVNPVAATTPSASRILSASTAPVNLFQAAATATAGRSTTLSPRDVDPVFAQRLLQQITGWNPLRAGANMAAAARRSVLSPSRSAPPLDTPPLEERFHVELRELEAAGFTDRTQNLHALTLRGGNVNSAIDYLRNGGDS